MSPLSFTIIGGGGKVARHFTRLATEAGHKVNSVIKDNGHAADLQSIGATTHILSLGDASVSDLSALFTKLKPDAVVFSAGAAGKPPGPDVIDHQGAVKVFDALEESGVRRLLYVGAIDVRSRDKAVPEWYNEEDLKQSEGAWGSIGTYMQAKLDAELNLHTRKSIDYTVLRPGHLTTEPESGASIGKVHIGSASRELVAKVLLAAATTPGTEGLTLDVMDGKGSVQGELDKAVREKADAWTG
ncbi:hypothetical protein IAT38_006304 [Cryptococcus sp. DSM 104549]